ncbi:hypothetical protein ACFVHB_20150 [Kitasatospora sp. NPDC127111]
MNGLLIYIVCVLWAGGCFALVVLLLAGLFGLAHRLCGCLKERKR